MYNEKDPSLNLEVHKHSEALPIYCTIDEINMLMSSFDDTDPVQYLDHAMLEFDLLAAV
jgi:site-specific recombinase XerD